VRQVVYLQEFLGLVSWKAIKDHKLNLKVYG